MIVRDYHNFGKFLYIEKAAWGFSIQGAVTPMDLGFKISKSKTNGRAYES